MTTNQVTFSGDYPGGVAIVFKPMGNDPRLSRWTINLASEPHNGYPDSTFNIGYNTSPGGDAVDPTIPAICEMMEGDYRGDRSYTEVYTGWSPPGHAQIRLEFIRACNEPLANGSYEVVKAFQVSEFHVQSPDGLDYFAVNPTGMYMSYQPGSSIKISEGVSTANEHTVSIAHDGPAAGLQLLAWLYVHLPGLAFFVDKLQVYVDMLFENGSNIGRPDSKRPANVYVRDAVHVNMIVMQDSATGQYHNITLCNGQLTVSV